MGSKNIFQAVMQVPFFSVYVAGAQDEVDNFTPSEVISALGRN
jgi:hypothetical protein